MKIDETKHTCGECFHFDACQRMMERCVPLADDCWDDLGEDSACKNFIEASLVMSAFRAVEKLRGGKDAKPSKKCVTIKLPLSEAMHLRSMAGSRVDKVYDSISLYEDEGIAVPSWLEDELKEKSGIYDKIQQAIDDYYR